MAVGGPNSRSDYHIEEGEELFMQLEGTLLLGVEERGRKRVIEMKAGTIFLLPARVPHSPVRLAGGVGIVLERQRRKGEKDGLRWYEQAPTDSTEEDKATSILYEEWFTCTDLGKDLKPIIERFNASEEGKTGRRAPGTALPEPLVEVDTTSEIDDPIVIEDWIDTHAPGGGGNAGNVTRKHLYSRDEFEVSVSFGGGAGTWRGGEGIGGSEVFLRVMRGGGRLHVQGEEEEGRELKRGDLVLVPASKAYKLDVHVGGAVLEVGMKHRSRRDE